MRVTAGISISVVSCASARVFIDAITEVRNRQHIPQPQSAGSDPLAVDPDAVGTAQVTYDDFTVLLRQTAMATREPQRFSTRVTRGVPSDNDHVLVDHDVWAPIEGHESRSH
jgi:hypothetical protein